MPRKTQASRAANCILSTRGRPELRRRRTPLGFALRKALACAALVLALVPGAALAIQITAAGVGVAPDHTRIVLEADRPIRFSLFSLRNPERAVLDLEGVELNAVLGWLASPVPADHPYIKQIRVQKNGANGVRVEVDFKTEVEPRITTAVPEEEHGHRLALDLYPAQRATSMPPAAQIVVPRPPSALPAPPATHSSPPPGVSAEEVWLAVGINEQKPAEAVLLLRRHDGRLLARRDDLERWRLRLPDAPPVTHAGEAFYPLDTLRGLSYRVDEAAQALVVNAAPGLFGTTEIRGRAAGFSDPSPAPPGAFLNYDVFAQQADGKASASGLLELGGFSGSGVGVSNFLARSADAGRRVVRLDTTWTRDRPGELATLRLGDAISGAGGWGRSVRFGGVQWATNFNTQPGFITFPLPGLSGEAVLPSTVDLYVNDALRLRRDVPTGPFSIQDLPVVTGQGVARLVVRDALGRERVINQPYYASPRLLQQGLHDYSYELGRVRENFGVTSNDYGRALAVGTHRLGLSDRVTGEAHVEVVGGQQTLGVGGALLWPRLGVLNASVAGSRSERGAGTLAALGLERQGRWLSFGGQTQIRSERFAQLGMQPGDTAPRQISQVFASVATSGYGSLGLGYTVQNFREREPVKVLNASYSVSLGKLGFLSLSLLRFQGEDSKYFAGLTFTRSLDERTSASAMATSQQGGGQALFQAQRNLPAGSGVGYRVLAGAGGPERLEAGLSAQSDIGAYSVEAGKSGAQTAFRAGASGGMALVGGEGFLSRRITDSFAVVRVPDYPNVRIYADNQLVARTGRDGTALLPRLRPYQKNPVRIEQADLPLDVQIGAVQLDAVPYFRSGLLLQFPVKRSRGALLTVLLENGEPLPAGAVAQIIPEKEEHPAGLRGEIYLTGLSASNRLQVSWRGQSCEFTVLFPDTGEPLPHLGTYTCKGVKP
jgi:outer membrane usher protein